MHSIRTKILLVFCISVLGVYALLVFFGIYFMEREVSKETDQTMSMLLQQTARELNVDFEGMERALDALEGYVKNNADLSRIEKDEAYRELFLANFDHLAKDVASVAGNVYAYYFRADPERYGSDFGVFVTDNGYGEYTRMTLTDLGAYDEDDREHVAWYYEPIKSGQPIWLEPYENQNINVYMTSYVSPVYIDGKFLGVVGLDLDMTLVQEIVDSVDYLGGDAYLLAKNGDIIYSKEYPEGLKSMYLEGEKKEARLELMNKWETSDGSNSYLWKGKNTYIITKNLINGMVLAISAPMKEIYQPVRKMLRKMINVLGFVMILLLFVTWRIRKGLISPLRNLTEASSRIAKGELNTQITYTSKDEIGELSESINSIAKELREYFAYIHSQAYTDGMTGVGNKTSYLDLVKRMERKIEMRMASFAVIVFDMNGLKRINDSLGHEVGDHYIVEAAEILKKIVGAEHIYRIGGDEFMVVLENADHEKVASYLEKMDEAVRKKNEEERYREEPLAISKGAAVYNPELDKAYKDVFKRADEAMYRNKAEFYRGKNDRRQR
ncbi:MAG: diguanylate cyclase [Lachnospiraceae bacterium]|nr:diguanylate cyclase [Lachnospiraceae bacterium]